jgi:hypothetical protein
MVRERESGAQGKPLSHLAGAMAQHKRPESPLLLFQGGKCASNGCLGLDSCRIFLATMFETRYDSFLLKKARSSIESSPPTFR